MDYQNKAKKLEEIILTGLELSKIKDIDLLLELILFKARQLTNSDAGSIYIKEGNYLRFAFSQNDTIQKRLKEKKLPYTSFKIEINEKSLSGYVAKTGKVLNIDDVYKITKNESYSFNCEYDKKFDYKTKSVLTVPLKSINDEILGVFQLINKKNQDGELTIFENEEITVVQHFANLASAALERAKLTRDIILRMIKMAELRDPKETGAHVERVSYYSIEIYENWAKKKNIVEKKIEADKDILKLASMLHDVGKIAISDRILKKPDKLTDEEFAEMKKHTYLGAKLFSSGITELDKACEEIALNHHEKWDGTGYPGWINIETGQPLEDYKNDDGAARGKKGEEIPLFARIVALADVYDALSETRSYKKPWTEEEILNFIKAQSGKHFDLEIVESFLDCYDIIISIKKQPKENE
ncbi:MAG TPA: HD domain-containing protein [bacterium]|nr:HD domain-containing protein [bacterium]HOL47359.1 HD domain-containing protein [bacterium]HPQ18908.1 HD domain-containing protein [bacterium]